MNSFAVMFLTRPGCHLCDDARPLVEWAASRANVMLEELDIDGDDRLVSLYGLRIPVVLGPDEAVLAEGAISSRRQLLRRIREVRRAQPE